MSEDRFQLLRLLEATLFATSEPMAEKSLAERLPEGADIAGLLQELAGLYANRGVHLLQIGERWAFRTAPDLGDRLQIETTSPASSPVPPSRPWPSSPITSP
jgi:Predicted transcriptional regulator containing the HTH domain